VALVLVAAALGLFTNAQMRDLVGDVPAALGQVLNWRLIVTGQTYGAQFTAPSPLQHYWSLAIEEQFYVLFPLLVAGCGVIARRRRLSVRAVVGTMAVVVIVGSAVASLIVGPSGSRAYFGTDTRAAELAVGALLAVVWFGREPIRAFWTRTAVEVAGLAAIGYWVWTWRSVGLTDGWLFPWGLLLTAVATSAVIVAALQRGWMSGALGATPLRALGRISYGVYLLHWPIGRLLTPGRTGLGPWPLFGLQTAVSLAAATLSFHLVEMPIRCGAGTGFRRAALVGAVVAALLLTTNMVVNDVAPTASALTRKTVPKAAPTRIMLVGDQLAHSLSPDISALAATKFVSRVATAPSCGLTMGGWVQLPDGRVEADSDRCGTVGSLWSAAVAAFRPDVVVVWGGMRDVANRRLGTDIPWSAPPSPQLDQFLEAGLRERLGDLAAGGAKVVVLTMPVVDSAPAVPPTLPPVPAPTTNDQSIARREVDYALAQAKENAPAPVAGETQPARVADFNRLLRSAARSTGASVLATYAVVTSQVGVVTGAGVDPPSAAAVTRLVVAAATGAHRQVRSAKVAAPTAPLPAAPKPTPRRTPGDVIRTTVVGDSVGIEIANGLNQWGTLHHMEVSDQSALGCPIARGGLYRAGPQTASFPTACSWAEPGGFPRVLEQTSPDVVVVEDGAWEVLDRLPAGATTWEHVGQPAADRFILAELLRAVDLLGSDGARVVLLTSAHVHHLSEQGFVLMPDSDPKRIDAFNKLLRRAAAMRPGVATVLEFVEWVEKQPGGEYSPNVREDGVHYLPQFGPAIGGFIGPRIADLERH